MKSLTCPECGARLAEGAERCDLCGSPISDALDAPRRFDEPGSDDIPDPQTTAGVSMDAASGPEGTVETGADTRVYCNACGWSNPAGAKFCSRCGEELEQIHAAAPAAPPPSVPPEARPVTARDAGITGDTGEGDTGEKVTEGVPDESSVGLHVAVLVGLSLLVVIALYMITVISNQRVDTNAEASVDAPADVRSRAVINEYEAIPIGDRFAPVVDSLRAVIASSERSASFQARRELVDFLIDIGRIDRAAIEQQRLARETDEVDDWRRAGNLLYDWMESVPSERRTDVAFLTIEAYETVLETVPDDLDVRADLGWAYQYDPQNPMEAIQHTNLVLEEEPDHLAANYYRGVFLLRINRVEDAVAQFQRVGELAEAGSPYARQAESWIRTIREQQSR